MERKPVRSSNVKAVGYDPATELLEVEFTNGGIYQYKKVPVTAYERLMRAESIGGTFAAEIKHIYQFEKVS